MTTGMHMEYAMCMQHGRQNDVGMQHMLSYWLLTVPALQIYWYWYNWLGEPPVLNTCLPTPATIHP
jgi:hypothetical protein